MTGFDIATAIFGALAGVTHLGVTLLRVEGVHRILTARTALRIGLAFAAISVIPVLLAQGSPIWLGRAAVSAAVLAGVDTTIQLWSCNLSQNAPEAGGCVVLGGTMVVLIAVVFGATWLARSGG